MPFSIVRDDITHVHADAIVNAANEQLRMGGGVCGAIFRAAGARRLQRACDRIGHCDTGNAVVTPAFDLPARKVIHTVGPIWQGGTHGERELLASCYRTSLELAESLGCRSIAFPLISAGIYGYPRKEALEVARGEILSFIATHEIDVSLVLYDTGVVQVADDLRMRITRYIDDVYVDAHAGHLARERWELESLDASARTDLNIALAESAPEAPAETGTFGYCSHCGAPIDPQASYCTTCGHPLDGFDAWIDDTGALADAMPTAPSSAEPFYGSASAMPEPMSAPMAAPAPAPLEKARRRRGLTLPNPLRNLLDHMDAGFSETLLGLIDERGLKDAQVYKRANISRQHFSKMRSNPAYRPTKTTVLALAVALELSLEETQMLLERAGFALSHADRRDVIVEFFIREGTYDVFQINDALFAFDQPLLG